MPHTFPRYPSKPNRAGYARIKWQQVTYHLGKHGSEKSYAEYNRLYAEYAKDPPAPKMTFNPGLTIDQLIATWLDNEPRGKHHPQVKAVSRACVPLSRLFGNTLANDFRANRLRVLQKAMVDCSWMDPEEREKNGDWAAEYINKSVERILRVFNFGESTELLPMGITEHLRTVPKIQPNDPRVRHKIDREPVDWDSQVKPVLPFLAPVVRAMLTVQYYAGMRPDEVCTMRRCEIDQSREDGIWTYRPDNHKNKWRKLSRVITLGPIAQRTLAPWLMAAEPDGYVFPPAKRRNNAEFYLENGYGQAVRRGIKEAKVKHWCPYSLRHAAGHRAEEAGGLSAAAAFLGHHSLETTKIYTDKERLELAARTAKKIG